MENILPPKNWRKWPSILVTKTIHKMKKINTILLILGLIGIISYQGFIHYQELHPPAIDRLVKMKLLNKDAMGYVSPKDFNRMELIMKVTKGDKNAAFDLGIYYEKAELPEAAFYWFGIAIKLGHECMSKEGLAFYEHNIIDKYAK
jgi:hypothetical protein